MGSFSGDRLRQARHRNGWTQAQLAHRANVRERQIIRWENNQHEPRFDAITALAAALGVDVSVLCDPSDDEDESVPMTHGRDMLKVLYTQLGAALGEKVA